MAESSQSHLSMCTRRVAMGQHDGHTHSGMSAHQCACSQILHQNLPAFKWSPNAEHCSSSLVNHHGLERGTLQFVLGQGAHNTLCIHHVCHAVTEHVAVITDTAERSREQWAIDRSRVPVYSFRLRPTQPTGGLQAACHTCVLHSEALQVPHDQTHPIG